MSNYKMVKYHCILIKVLGVQQLKLTKAAVQCVALQDLHFPNLPDQSETNYIVNHDNGKR